MAETVQYKLTLRTLDGLNRTIVMKREVQPDDAPFTPEVAANELRKQQSMYHLVRDPDDATKILKDEKGVPLKGKPYFPAGDIISVERVNPTESHPAIVAMKQKMAEPVAG